MRKRSLNSKKLIFTQENFIKAIEGIGDILIYNTRQNNKNKIVLQGLEKINKIIKGLFSIKKNEPEKFEKLILSQDLLKLYKKNMEEAKFRLSLNPKEYLITFTTAINQILRIHETAVEFKNYEVSKFATYHLDWVLEYITSEKNNSIFVEQLLKSIHKANIIAINNKDISMYSSSIQWYLNIVFDEWRQKDSKFDLSYLELFDKYFFSSIQNIVSSNIEELFKNLVSSLIDGVHIDLHEDRSVWDYGYIILNKDLEKYDQIDKEYNIENRIKELNDSYNYLYSRKEYDSWIEKFQEFKNILFKYFDKSQKEEAKKIENEVISNATTRFKYNNLLEIIFAVGAYCLFENRPELITYLWEYKQPPDSDSVYIGHDIVPTNINQLIGLYFRKELFARRFDFWVGHHGNELYLKKYFILLLLRLLEKIKPNERGQYEQIDSFQLPNLNIYSLSNIEYSVDEFINIAEQMREDLNLFKRLRFNAKEIDNLFRKKLFSFLNILKNRAQKRIEELSKINKTSDKKIEEFKSEFLKEFYESSIFRSIFKHYHIYMDKVGTEYKGKLERLGINQVIDKAAFFDEWHVHYSGIGNNYGRGLARAEDYLMYKKIINKCKPLENMGFEEALEMFQNLSDVIAIVVNVNSYIHFSKSKEFKPKWYNDCPKCSIQNFEGVYSFKNINIPIFDFFKQGEGKKIIILDMSNFGSFIQYSPIDNEDEKNFLYDIFYFYIVSFSENEIILKKMLDKPPKWLEKIGDSNTQKELLKSKVLINIFDRNDFSFKEKFKGFYYELENDLMGSVT